MKLKDYIESSGMTKRFFAKKLGISYAMLFKYFHGQKSSKFVARYVEEITDGNVTAMEMMQIDEDEKAPE